MSSTVKAYGFRTGILRFVEYDEAILREVIETDCYRLGPPEGGPSWSVEQLLVLDGGACFGAFSLYAAALGAFNVVAYEPNPLAQRMFEANLEMNPHLSSRIRLVKKALGYPCQHQRRVQLDTQNIGGGRLTPHPGAEVEVEPLNAAFEMLCASPAINNVRMFLKLDVEGAERELFHPDNRRLLSSFDYVSMEWHNHDGAVYALALEALGFKVDLGTWDPTIGGGILHARPRGIGSRT